MVLDSNRTMSISPDGKVIRVFTLSPYTFAIEKSGRKANAIIRLNADEYLKIVSTSPKKIVIQHEQAIFIRTISDITLIEEILGMKLVNISWEQHTTEHTHTFENVDPNYTHSQCLEEEEEYRLIPVSTRLLHELDAHKADLTYDQYIDDLSTFCTTPPHKTLGRAKMTGCLGIDPGLSGGLVFIVDDKIKYKIVMPTISITNADGDKKTDLDRHGILSFLTLIPAHTHVVIEKQVAYRGQNISATGTTFKNYGVLLMGLTAAHFFITETESDVWQAFYGIVSAKKANGKTTKQQALPIAQKLFPDVDFRKSDRSHIAHDGIVDSALLANYCQSLFTASYKSPESLHVKPIAGAEGTVKPFRS